MLPTPPDRITLTFSGPVAADSRVTVVGDGFERFDDGAVLPDPSDPNRLSVGLTPSASGELTVQYEAKDTADGHMTQGAFSFEIEGDLGPRDTSVDTAAPATQPAAGDVATSPSPIEAAPQDAVPNAGPESVDASDATGSSSMARNVALLAMVVVVAAGIWLAAGQRR